MARNAGSNENIRFDEIRQITRDGTNKLANLTILAFFMQIGIMSYPSEAADFDDFEEF